MKKKYLKKYVFIVDEMKHNFISWVVGVNRCIEKPIQSRARYKDKHVGSNNGSIY